MDFKALDKFLPMRWRQAVIRRRGFDRHISLLVAEQLGTTTRESSRNSFMIIPCLSHTWKMNAQTTSPGNSGGKPIAYT